MYELVHKDVLKRLLQSSSDASVQLYSRATVSLSVFTCDDSGSPQESTFQPARCHSLEQLLADADTLKLFANNASPPLPGYSVASPSMQGVVYRSMGQADALETIVGEGDVASPSLPALDIALQTMKKGETAMFAARAKHGYSREEVGDLVFHVHVREVYPEVDLTVGLPPRQITKHVVLAAANPSRDAHGQSMPLYGATVDCIVINVHPFTEKPLVRQNLTVEVGGVDHEQWLDTALRSMCEKELATVRVASTGAIYKVRVNAFKNLELPRSPDALLRRVEDLKQNGNELFLKRHRRTAARYEAALYWIHYAKSALTSQVSSDKAFAAKLRDLELALEGNLSQIHLNDKKYSLACDHASNAIRIDPQAFKNIFRRAKAKRGLKLYQEALLDLNRAQLVMEDLKIHTDSPDWKALDDERTELEGENC